jgi:hypothetical protein
VPDDFVPQAYVFEKLDLGVIEVIDDGGSPFSLPDDLGSPILEIAEPEFSA